MRYTLKQLKYFLAVAEYGNVTEASERLFISQPSISSAVSQLEEAFEVDLLIRHHAKGVSLTAAGRELTVLAKSLLSHADEIQSRIHAHGSAMSGVIHLGCFVTLAPVYVPKLMQRFRREYPEIEFVLFEGNIEEIYQALLSGDIEVALVYDLGAQERADKVELASLAPNVVLPAKHKLAQRTSIRLNALKEEPMILLDLPHSRDYFFSLFELHDFKPTILHRTRSFEMVRSLVANGSGYSILNLVPNTKVCYDGSKIASIPLAENTKPLRLVLSRTTGVKHSMRVQVFVDFCKREFKVDL
ncbi:MAG: LysR substrate-binding domain-containing protein [Pseudomonadota bacterium]